MQRKKMERFHGPINRALSQCNSEIGAAVSRCEMHRRQRVMDKGENPTSLFFDG